MIPVDEARGDASFFPTSFGGFDKTLAPFLLTTFDPAWLAPFPEPPTSVRATLSSKGELPINLPERVNGLIEAELESGLNLELDPVSNFLSELELAFRL